MRLTDRPIQGVRDPAEIDTTTLRCGIDCDGGLMEVERVAGSRDVIFRFGAAAGGLRMSRGCSGGGTYHVGGAAKPYDAGSQKEHAPPSFRLRPICPPAR
jgi:hypothetical protein